MFANYAVSSKGDTTAISASFRAGEKAGADWVQLVEGDTVSADVGGEAVALEESSPFNRYTYSADVETPAAGTVFTFSLTRTGQESAPASSVTLPAPFEISSPAEGSTYSPVDGALVVEWSPVTDGWVDISVSGSCIDGTDEKLEEDAGTFTVPDNAFDANADDGEEATACDVTISVIQTQPGETDPNLAEGSTILAHQERSVTLAFSPDPDAKASGCSMASGSPSGLVLVLAGGVRGRRRRV